jgi:hypothetical protein
MAEGEESFIRRKSRERVGRIVGSNGVVSRTGKTKISINFTIKV